MNSDRPTDGGKHQPAPAPPHAYSVRAHSLSGGRSAAAAGNQTIPFDATWDVPAPGLPGPAELLAAAFAACLLKNVERTSKRLGIQYQDATVDVTAERQDAPPKFSAITYELRLTTNEREQRIDLLHRNLRRYGTVYNTLAAGCSIEGRIVRLPLGS